jgi:predicted aspartyl protease
MRVWATSLGIALGLALPGSLRADPPAGETSVSRSTIVNSVGFVEGTIDGKGPYWFLIDTGANRSAIDTKVARELGILSTGSSKVEGSAGSLTVEEARVPSLELGTTRVRDLQPTVYDLSGSLAPPGEHIAGILGFDALGSSAVLWDRDERRVVVAPSAAAFTSFQNVTVLPLSLDNGIPRIRAHIDGKAVRLRIDTGAAIGDGPNTFVNVTRAFYDELRATDPTLQPYTYFTATGVGGETRIPVAKAHELTLGKARIRDPRLIVQQPVGYFSRADAVGFLGGYAFNQWSGFIVDYPRRRLILLPK